LSGQASANDHILETARTESLDAGKLDLQVMGQARAGAYIGLMDVTQDTADAWFHWASAIETEGLSARTVRDAILGLVGEFVMLSFLECLQSQAHR
jgi:hypothetical protein